MGIVAVPSWVPIARCGLWFRVNLNNSGLGIGVGVRVRIRGRVGVGVGARVGVRVLDDLDH